MLVKIKLDYVSEALSTAPGTQWASSNAVSPRKQRLRIGFILNKQVLALVHRRC